MDKQCMCANGVAEYRVFLDGEKNVEIDSSEIRFCPICGNELPNKQNAQKVPVDVEKILDTIKSLYRDGGYSSRFNRTATRKKIVTALKSTAKCKRLYPLEIVLAFKLYLYEEAQKETDAQFVKMSDTFMSNQVYDYASKPSISKRFNEMMAEKYGEKWRSVKFDYK